MKLSIIWIIGSLAVMWVVEIINGFIGHRLSVWGILPRTTSGLIGIPLSPFLHGSFNIVCPTPSLFWCLVDLWD